MNDKQQLAAMGEHMAEHMAGQAEQPLCMAKRIEELEAQVMVMAGLLRETLTYVDGPKWQSLIGDRKAHLFLGRIDAALSGKLPAVVEVKKPRITGIDGNADDGGFSVKFPDGLFGEPAIHFKSLCIDGDGVSGPHICALLAAANWLIDMADWYRKGSAIIHQPCTMLASAPSPDSAK